MKNTWNENNRLLREAESFMQNYTFIITFESEYDRYQAFKKLKNMGYKPVLLEQAISDDEYAPRHLQRAADSREALYLDYKSDKEPSSAILEFLDKVEKDIPKILNIWDEDFF